MEGRAAIPSRRWPAWANSAALLIAGWTALAILTLQVRPGATIVAVAFPPWWSTQQVFQAAGSAQAGIVRATALPTLLVVRPDDHDGLSRLHEAGAWFVMDAQAVSACFGR
ncbi:hypothetical protein C7U92_18360 [Bradyrhizobium sp. WBOS7]|uniref:Uncharacterized protein n=1 Tax=Bradyrhizobium betae TaxID=244734 RepID=A0AAE9N5D1_9BRAD|nr:MULTISPECIES: hypothetical protein [unclassified Bradyrhizobium]MDD1572755.1 hypothetical protein [Bradyrhizobium sp. WBOS1]UUO33598.1 hypothetical protein DCK84_02740 [Bradyrhizobium sp. WBOS01]UUO39794.1 hypothetical protein DCM75_02825 [Bradyrhizobium sp. WBOS02]UUO52006.1 hypothetical protein DCM79_02730 [Bradyrhizobium sp. WBOS07]UUO64301.1 hypothetical protein DCM83_03065 [Bradyrhizobium betae]